MDERALLNQELNEAMGRRRVNLRRTGSLLSKKSYKYAAAFAAHMDSRQAAAEAGFKERRYESSRERGLMNNQLVQIKVLDSVKKFEEQTELKAKYIRDYIHSILEFCPGDHFRPTPSGEWMIDQETYDTLPAEVRRLIETMTLVNFQGATYLSVTFISKTAALSLACRYTLTQQVHLQDKQQLPWDRIAKIVERPARRSVEDRLREYDAQLNGAKNEAG